MLVALCPEDFPHHLYSDIAVLAGNRSDDFTDHLTAGLQLLAHTPDVRLQSVMQLHCRIARRGLGQVHRLKRSTRLEHRARERRGLALRVEACVRLEHSTYNRVALSHLVLSAKASATILQRASFHMLRSTTAFWSNSA